MAERLRVTFIGWDNVTENAKWYDAAHHDNLSSGAFASFRSAVSKPSENQPDLRQHLSGFCLLALLLPQPAQAYLRSQLKSFRLLLTGNVDSLEKTRFGFRLRLDAGC